MKLLELAFAQTQIRDTVENSRIQKTLLSRLVNPKVLLNLQAKLDARALKGKGASVKVLSRNLRTNEIHLRCIVHGNFSEDFVTLRDNQTWTCRQCFEAYKVETLWVDRLKEVIRPCKDFHQVQINAATKKVRFICAAHNQRIVKHVSTNTLSELIRLEKTAINWCPLCLANSKKDGALRNGWMWTLDQVNKEIRPQGLKCLTWNGTVSQSLFACIKRGHTFSAQGQSPVYHKTGCPKCSNCISKGQLEVFNFVKTLAPDAVLEKPAHELNSAWTSRSGYKIARFDIYVPSKNLVIEYDGIWWHKGERFQDRNFKMFSLLKSHGIRLFVIRDNEWQGDKEKWKRHIRNLFVRLDTLRASSLVLKRISCSDAAAFYDRHHTQGKVTSGLTWALVESDKIYAAMTFDRIKSNRGHKASRSKIELTRFCVRSGFTVHGAAGKLYSHMLRITKPDMVVSYSHNRWFSGQVYKALGFSFDGQVAPDYQTLWSGQYGIKGLRSKQFSCKKNLAKLGENTTDYTEAEILRNLGVHKLYDFGKQRWVHKIN